MCIEEPEIHLHPILQRKLIQYLLHKTENQYFIATHSAAFIDMPGATVFRVENDGVQTTVDPVIVKEDKRQLCADLGYLASDIMHANAVIWVEGPSDRIYVKYWLQSVAPELVEGVHYTIMFFGGGLISHLSADDNAVEEFIKLRDLNGNMAIIIDSDRENARAKLKPAAQRIKQEMGEGNAMTWITKGREIENYIRPEILHNALAKLHPRIYGGKCSVGPFDHSFYFKDKRKNIKSNIYTAADKVGAAKLIAEQVADLSVLDLKKKITQLAELIKAANAKP